MAAKKTTAAPKAAAAKKSAGGTKSAPAAAGKKEKSLGELVGALAERAGLTKVKAKEVLDAHSTLLIEELKQNGSVLLAGVGKLKMGERAERQGRNPSTGKAITIKASKTVKFAPGKAFKENVQ